TKTSPVPRLETPVPVFEVVTRSVPALTVVIPENAVAPLGAASVSVPPLLLVRGPVPLRLPARVMLLPLVLTVAPRLLIVTARSVLALPEAKIVPLLTETPELPPKALLLPMPKVLLLVTVTAPVKLLLPLRLT